MGMECLIPFIKLNYLLIYDINLFVFVYKFIAIIFRILKAVNYN